MTIPTIIEFVTDPQLLGLSISPAQETLLRSIYALPLSAEQMEIFTQCTGRDEPLQQEVAEATIISGVRSGKDSRIATPIAAYEAAFGEHDVTLSTGETGVIAITCQDLRATQVTYGYLKAYFTSSPVLRTMLDGEPKAQSLDLVNRLQVRCFPTVTGATRTWSIPVGIMNEPAFYRLEGSVNSDAEIQTSLRRGMVNFVRSKLVKISTPYMKSGVVFEDFTQFYGQPDPDRLVWRSSTALMNPAISEARLALQRRLDPMRYSREFEAEFADDVAAAWPRAWIDACVRTDRFELPPNRSYMAIAAIDPSGGGTNAFTLAIVWVMAEGMIVQAVMRGQARQGSAAPDLEGLVKDYVTLARQYGCEEIVSDSYAAEWVKQAVERHNMRFRRSELSASEAYLNLEPLLARQTIELLDHAQMIRELGMLERRPRPGGKDVIEPPRGSTHGDYSNALALAAAHATVALRKPQATAAAIMPADYGRDDDWRRPFFGLPPRRASGLPAWMVPAPRVETPSHERLAWDMELEAEEEKKRQLAREHQEHVNKLAEEAAVEQRERDERARWRAMGLLKPKEE